MTLPDETELAEQFEYLDDLRESGETNMFGARPYLEGEFDLDAAVAGRVVSAWMSTFDDSSPQDRARKALSEQVQS